MYLFWRTVERCDVMGGNCGGNNGLSVVKSFIPLKNHHLSCKSISVPHSIENLVTLVKFLLIDSDHSSNFRCLISSVFSNYSSIRAFLILDFIFLISISFFGPITLCRQDASLARRYYALTFITS